ncbi:dCTP deaminase [Sulfodiicoccus acidiphilus]|nr:dCTP deaminase [Sulfodiicoccus acidiphilus]
MILGDRDLKYFIDRGLIKVEPFSEDTVRENGLDLRVGKQIARMVNAGVLRLGEDVSNFFKVEDGEEFVINPSEHVLLTTQEYLELPTDVMAFVNLRSSFARLGLFIPPTIVDAGFKGELTIEVVGSAFPVELRAGTRFLHLVFAKTLTPIERPYSGKYQGQRGVTLPKFVK